MFAESGVGSDISSGIIDLCDDSDDDDVAERQPIYLEDQGVLEKVFAEEWDYVPSISTIQPNDEQATIDAIFDQEDPFAVTTADAAAADADGAAATGNISPSPPSPDFDPSQARGLDDEVVQLEQQIEQAVSSDEAQQTAAQPRLINRKNPSARSLLTWPLNGLYSNNLSWSTRQKADVDSVFTASCANLTSNRKMGASDLNKAFDSKGEFSDLSP
ncbi:uncharacterized protein LOC126845488, partial [Adelges cooleyi]|uniref:uncharacterized protein LOC126845488 n=1 Tax=Adelges cooleyi TaxID=133065 RepID=UPI00217F5BFA